MDLTDFYSTPLAENDDLSGFDYADEEINEFLIDDAINFQKEKITNTFLFKNEDGRVMAFFSISNDCLNDLGYENNAWNRLHCRIKLPNQKRIRQYPAVKINRLEVDYTMQGQGIAHQLLDFIKYWTLIEHKPACRLLILDAYKKPKQLSLYQKNDFIFLSDNNQNDKHRFMYFDLLRLA